MRLQNLLEAEERSVLSMMGQQPTTKKGMFSCRSKKLTSLIGGPVKVDNFNCQHNLLTSLEGGPAEVESRYICSHNKLISLKGTPTKVHYFDCGNNNLTSLEGVPTVFNGAFTCYDNKLTSLQNIHRHIKFIGGSADFRKNPIKSHVLGLLKIKNLREVWLDNREVSIIINKHLADDRDVIACQDELIDADFDEYAQL
jgi:Leucine-rich repeat (LRR) protein